MKENSPTIYNNSWGILGYPSHEKIEVTDIYLTSVIVSAVGSSQSFDIARSQQDQLVFNEEPNHKGVVSYSYHSYNPQRWE